MKVMYTKPKLRKLSQGSRIAFSMRKIIQKLNIV